MAAVDAKTKAAISEKIVEEVAKQTGAPVPKTKKEAPAAGAPAVSGEQTAESKKILESLKYHLKFSTDLAPRCLTQEKCFRTVAAATREQLMERWNLTYEHYHKTDPKEGSYISMEFLMGRLLRNSVGCLCLTDEFGTAMKELGWTLEELETQEHDAGLGNGGLGRLAACFLDSMATLSLPAWGYALRYKYGIFRQVLDKEGRQTETAEPWLEHGNPWEVRRADVRWPICFGGKVVGGKWVPEQILAAVPHDIPIPGYKTKNVNTLRCWNAEPIVEKFNMFKFNECEYTVALADHILCEKLMSVLYPGDHDREGKALRLRQQYLLSSASVQDIIARFEERAMAKKGKVDWSDLPNKVTIQMNDTHPTLAAPELQRILIDVKGLDWATAFGITSKCVAYTNHTLMPEALECWPLDLLEELLPRHVEIIKQIDQEFMAMVKAKYSAWPKDQLNAALENMCVLKNYYTKTASLSLLPMPSETPATVHEAPPKPLVRMANLCMICGYAVNGVAALHTELCKHVVFTDFYKLWPEKFQNKTNGVTPRRWLAFCNPQLAAVITKWLGSDAWIKDTVQLKGLDTHRDKPELHAEWTHAKNVRKQILWSMIMRTVHPDVKGPPIEDVSGWMFDIQIKRMHEYKRQLLNLLSIVYRYRQFKAMSPAERAKQVPRVCLLGGKAFYSYWAAKECVFLCSAIGRVINNDPDMAGLMRVYFMENYNVSLAEILIPAAELCQQISTAGTEASGTSNMKFQMNGCLQIGTLDGANVEIRECVGAENFFLFGTTAEKVAGIREARRLGKFVPPKSFLEVTDFLKTGPFGDFTNLMGTLEGNEGFGRGDYFLLGYDFESYIQAQAQVDKMYHDKTAWTRASITSTANSAKFSSDRTISQYAEEIWQIKPCPVPAA